jgi:hypothetical protein
MITTRMRVRILSDWQRHRIYSPQVEYFTVCALGFLASWLSDPIPAGKGDLYWSSGNKVLTRDLTLKYTLGLRILHVAGILHASSLRVLCKL